MKRYNNLMPLIYARDNILLAEKKAIKGKSKQLGVKLHLINREHNLESIEQILINGNYRTSEYKYSIISELKVRTIAKLPFYPDRIVQHCVVNVLEPLFYKTFISQTYSCIKRRGVHKASFKLREYLKEGQEYCLKFDIQKFFESVDKEILKTLLRKKFKDVDLLSLLDEIIDSGEKGLPLGNITSQFFGNYYLSYFDHFVKEQLKIKHYLRYTDDIVVLSSSKSELWDWFHKMKEYLGVCLNLKIKGNYQVFPIKNRGIDWVGYKHFHTHTLIRKSIKKKYVRSKNKKNHYGWLKHCNSVNLRVKYEGRVDTL